MTLLFLLKSHASSAQRRGFFTGPGTFTQPPKLKKKKAKRRLTEEELGRRQRQREEDDLLASLLEILDE